MGARLVVRFGNTDDSPRVYLHWGGEYQADAAQTVSDFLSEVRTLPDSRLDDMPYLAAKLVVWAANENRRSDSHLLDFLSVGVVTSDDYGDAVAVIEDGGTFYIEKALDLAAHR